MRQRGRTGRRLIKANEPDHEKARLRQRMNAKTAELEITEPILHDELVERCKQGDSRAYAALYQKYAKAMYNTSLRIVNNTGDAEDVTQEAFTDAFRSLEDFHYKS